MEPATTTTALYILEEGGEWPRWLVSAEAGGATVIRQEEGEGPAEFAVRVGQEVARLGDEVRLDRVVIACNERADARALAERREIGTRLLVQLAKRGSGSLIFTESQRQSGGSRAALSGLAADLSSEWEDAGLSVSVRFGQPSRPPQESIPPPSAPRGP